MWGRACRFVGLVRSVELVALVWLYVPAVWSSCVVLSAFHQQELCVRSCAQAPQGLVLRPVYPSYTVYIRVRKLHVALGY